MLNLSKVSSGSGEHMEIDISSSVFAERSSERSSPVLSLRIVLRLPRKALRALYAVFSPERSAERSAHADSYPLLLKSALPSALQRCC